MANEHNEKISNTFHVFHTKLLNFVIDESAKKHQRLMHQSHDRRNALLRNANCKQTMEILISTKEDEIESLKLEHICRLNKKLDRLRGEFYSQHSIEFKEKWFKNLTRLFIPLDVMWLMSLGGKFSVPTDNENFPLLHYIVDTEDCLESIEDERERSILRAKITNIISNHRSSPKLLTPLNKYILEAKRKTDIFLKENKDVFLIHADKGNASVLMYRADYHQKMKAMLNCEDYLIVGRNPLIGLEEKSNSFVKDLFNLGIIDKATRSRMTKHNTSIPRIYALPKIHKHDVPLRPIVDYSNSPATVIAKFLKDILNKVNNNTYDVKNSKEVCDRLMNVRLDENDRLTSFDVVSLFPSIPIDFAIRIIRKKWRKISTVTDVPRELFFEMLEFVLCDSTHFRYDNKIYKQLDGSAMGSNISPVIANIVLNHILDKVLKKLPFDIKICLKYVDDLLLIVPRDKINIVQDRLNEIHRKIQFTVESEENGKLPYLDLLLIRNSDGSLSHDWYRKETAAGRILNYNSHHPKHQRINTALGLLKRVRLLCSPELVENSIEDAKRILLDNGYPYKTVKQLIMRSLPVQSATTQAPVSDNLVNERIFYKSLPYVDGMTDNICNLIQKNNPGIKIAKKPMNQLRTSIFSSMKQKIDPLEKINVIYQIPCNGTEGVKCPLSYIGQTKNQLKKRRDQHNSDYRAAIRRNERHANGIHSPAKKNEGKTAIISHYEELSHVPATESIRAIDYEPSLKKRLILESLHILKNDTYNARKDIEGISHSYIALVQNM